MATNITLKGIMPERKIKVLVKYHLKGVLVDIKETIKGFNMIMDGEVDEYPEASFNLVGNIEDAIEKGKKILAEANA